SLMISYLSLMCVGVVNAVPFFLIYGHVYNNVCCSMSSSTTSNPNMGLIIYVSWFSLYVLVALCCCCFSNNSLYYTSPISEALLISTYLTLIVFSYLVYLDSLDS
ncbi:MAG: hypothetical protein ACKPKO_44980, partial [Candidatus Fonsibacter sp.]